MRKLFFATACTLLLSACVTEDGAKKHAAKQGAGQSNAMAGGVMWSATVYSSQKPGAATEMIGEFDSYRECIDQAMRHVREKGYADGAYACDA